MNPGFFQWHSLKTRVTLFTLAIFVVSIWALSIYTSRLLQADMQRLLGEQQFSTASVMAREINDRLIDRMQALETIAKEVTPAVLGHAAALQTRLEQRPLLQLLFNGGAWATRLDGTAIADVPRSAQRIGTNYLDRDSIIAALKDGKSSIGRPVMGRQLKAPVFAMTVPLHDAQGKVIGSLTGVTHLGQRNFLDQVVQGPYGKTGGFLLIARQHKLIVSASDKSRVMQPVPAAGLNAMHDQYMQGYQGFGIAVSSRGVLELSAATRIPAADWFIVVTLPASEAFAPIDSMLQHMLWASVLLTLLAGGLTWWMLRQQLAPLLATARALVALSNSNQIPAPLAVLSDDEVGQLASGFNRLIESWRQRETALQNSQQNLAITLNSIGDAVMATDPAGRITGMNPAAERLCGWTLADALGQPLMAVFRIVNAATRATAADPVQMVLAQGQVVGLANHTVLLARGGQEYQIADSAAPIRMAAGEIVGVVLVFSDVTERYRVELALHNSEQQYRSLLENLSCGVVVHSADTAILLSNAKAAFLLGLTQSQMLGKTSLDPDWCFLQDDGSPMRLADYPVNRVLTSGQGLHNFVVGVHHPDRSETTWVLCSAYPTRGEAGNILQVVVTFTDITERKQVEVALTDSEQRWKFAIEGAGDGLWDWNIQTGKAFYSPRYKAMLGFAEDEIGDSADEWSKRIHPDDAPGVMAALQPYLEGKPGSAAVEFRMLCQDGHWQWTQGRGLVVARDAQGKPLRMIGTNTDITERKRTQEAIEKRILALTQPLDGGKIGFDELFSLDEIQRIQDEFAFAMGVASLITQPDGTPITAPSNFTSLCGEIIRQTERGCANCFKSDAAIGRFNPTGPIKQPCLSGGLWDAGASITLGGHHIANWLIGQVRDETQTEDNMRAYARDIGANETLFMEAFYKVPAMSRDRFEKIAKALFTLANQLSLRAYQNVQQARYITEHKQAEAKLQLAAGVFTHALEGIMITGPDTSIIDVNRAFTRITGYTRDEVLGQNPRILNSGRHGREFFAALWRSLIEQGDWSGELWNRRKNGEVFAAMQAISAVRDAQGSLQQYISLFSDITERKAHEGQLEHIAHFDALTNLPNRVLLADRLQQAMAQAQRRGQQLAVAYLDLDGFKAINDHHGHQAGDLVLIALAQQMNEALRQGDTLARLGGDEFVAVLIDLEDASASAPLLNRLLAAAAQPVAVGDLSLQVSASLGVTFYPQAQDIDADQLLRQADQAMYQAKVAGKNRYQIFDAAQASSLRTHHESLERIRLALERGEFVLHYQPKVNMHSGRVVGAEALIRWQHPEKGLLAPAAFLPMIEDHPLAVAVGEWVIDSALTQIDRWHAAGLELAVSVNIGARQLQQGDFVARLQAILAAHPQVKPGCLDLEVLETSALADMAQVSQVIEDCARIGVKFALDDFGTGYSSLTYLKRLRVALLKIDQSFVRDMLDDADDLAILQGIIGLAAAFKREVIAEGVETVAHGSLLLQLGCELAQGYGIARPMPADQLPAWVATWQPDAAWIGVDG
ncbi:MAG: EAL domain-containing protein [Rhodoferax sp.]